MSMEESGGGELRPKSTPAMALATEKNSKLEQQQFLKKSNPSKVREEGELTSSDEDALPVCSGAPQSVTSAPSSNCVPNAPVRTNSQNVKSGKSVSTNFPAGSVDIRCQMALQSSHKRDFFKKKVPFRPSKPGWNAPLGTNNNLVISFSDDDDSGSDTDQLRREKAPEPNVNQHVLNSSQKPPDLPSVKLDNVQRTTRNEGKLPPKKGSLSRTFVSSMSKIHGVTSRSVGSSIAQQGSRSRNSNSVIKGLASQDRQCSKSVTVSDSKLQDLRQQIAIRENELKLKTVQQNKESLSEASKDSNIMNYSITAPRKGREMSVEVQFGPEEPERKRLKLAQNNLYQLSSGGLEEHRMKSTLVMNDPVLKKTGTHCRRVTEHSHHETEVPENEEPAGSVEMQIQARGPCVAANCSRSDMMSRPRETLVASNKNTSLLTSSLQNLLKTSSIEKSKHPNNVSGSHQAIPVNDVTKSASGHDKLRCTSDGNLRTLSVQASPDNTSHLNCLQRSTNPGFSDMDLQSLLEVEELHDKELEEAQEHRRRCEIEERNALKAYRMAQRALAAANAQCTFLYRRRELFAAELHSVLMEGSSLWWSRQHGLAGDDWNFFNNFCEVNAELIPASSNQMQTEFDAGNQIGNDSNVQSADGDAHHRFSPHVNGSEACSEPDDITSDTLPCKDNGPPDGVLSPSNEPNISADEDEETFQFDHPSGQANAEFLRKENNFEEKQKELDGNSIVDLSVDSTCDPLLLEAELRSRLVSRLGMSNSSKRNVYAAEATGERTAEDDIGSWRTEMIMENNSPANQALGFGSGYNREPAIERAVKDDVASVRNQMIVENVSVCYPEKSQITEFGGSQETEGAIAKLRFGVRNQQQVKEHSLNYSPEVATDLEHSAPTRGCQSMSIALQSPILKSVFYRKAASAVNSSHLQTVNQNIVTDDMCIDESSLMTSGEDELYIERGNCIEDIVRDGLVGRIDSYTCGSTVDPFWPLCMYELRGKCNDDECPWQHSKDYSRIKLNQHDGLEGADLQGGLSSHCQKQKGGIQSSSVLTPPTYLVCFDTLNDDSPSQGSLLPQKLGSSWRRIFSSCLVVSSSLPRNMPTEEPFLHGNDSSVEIRGNLNRQSLYFQSIYSTMGLLGNGFMDKDQPLETALLILNQEANKAEGVKRSLAILSRALEADSQSSCLWIVYLHIYYSNKDSTGEDDLFSCAVKHNEGSYELWLMYINSRRQLNDRSAAYERAISSLCHHSRAGDKDVVHASACILDLFLQMLNCYSVSGNVAKATQRIYGLLHAERDSDESNSLVLSDILSYLTISDKCVFWVCCVFFMIYGKLPEEVVQQLEYKKDISLVEWPSVYLTRDKKQLLKLIGMAADSVKLDVDSVPLQNKAALRPAHLFALNHVKLVAAIDGVESCENLLERYADWYPTCLELFLMSVQTCKSKSQSMRFLGFEEALRNWQDEVPGVQCIWNQYAAYALQGGGSDKAKEIMVRWFNSVWKVQYSQSALDEGDNDKKSGSADLLLELSSEAMLSSSNKTDLMFALLNLCLYRLLENDPLNALLAVNKALKIASHEDFRHCLGEHAIFLLNYGSQLGKDVSLCGKLDILKSLLVHVREFPNSEPLSRKFIQDIQKLRLRQLVNDLYHPIPPDFSFVNLVLEIWYGPSLLPPKFRKLKDLVNFVEAVLEISPSNYPLAISVCKLHSRDSNTTDVKSAGISFWASSLLVNTIYRAIPVAPEHVWVQAGGLLGNLTGIQAILESFYRRALSVYPFSIKLWNSFLNTCTEKSSRSKVVEAAREQGIEIE